MLPALFLLPLLALRASAGGLQPFRPPPSLAQPYAALHGGSFSGPPLTHCADPLGSYVWAAGVNASELQAYAVLPDEVVVVDGAPGAFAGEQSLLTPTPIPGSSAAARCVFRATTAVIPSTGPSGGTSQDGWRQAGHRSVCRSPSFATGRGSPN